MVLALYIQHRNLARDISTDIERYTHKYDPATHRNSPETSPNAGEPNHASKEQDGLHSSDEDAGYTLVTWTDENDQHNPINWPPAKKIIATLVVLTSGLTGGWASANLSMVAERAQDTFHVGAVAESLATGLYLMGFGIGSLFSGPFSETVGRIPIYLATSIIFTICVLISALSPNLVVQLIFRFFAGMAGCTAVTTFAGSCADIWQPSQRALVFGFCSVANFCFVFLAPVVGGFIAQAPDVSWRWAEWIALLISATSAILIALFAPESYGPQILSWKAKILQSKVKGANFRTQHSLQMAALRVRLFRSLTRPFDMLFHELSVVLVTAYLSVLYVVTFTFLTGFTFIFGDVYGLSENHVGLCFLGLDVGILIGAAIGVSLHLAYTRKQKESAKQSLPPESRLWYAIVTAPALPIGLFWMAWTAYRSISLWSNLGGTVLIGIAFFGTFIGTYLYIIDTFGTAAASALAIATTLRYVAAGVMVPVSIPMYRNLGVHWTLTLLGCISVLVTPVPFFMWKFGRTVARFSRFAKAS